MDQRFKPLTRQKAIELILLMNQLDQRKQAVETYNRTNEFHPEWNLKAAFEALRAAK